MNLPPEQPSGLPPPRKKSGNGCLIALLLVGSLLLAVVAVMAVGAYLVVTSKEGKQFLGILGQGARAVGETAKVLEDAARAPGASEVRALGCDKALAVDMAQLLRAFDQFDAGLASGKPPDVRVFVMCQARPLGTPPDCDPVARAYLSGAGKPPGDFAVMVSVEGSKHDRCTARYAPDGRKLGPYHGAKPPLPAAPAP